MGKGHWDTIAGPPSAHTPLGHLRQATTQAQPPAAAVIRLHFLAGIMRFATEEQENKCGHGLPRQTTPNIKLAGGCVCVRIFKPPGEMLWCVISTAAACSESLCSADFSSHQSLQLMLGASVSGCPMPAAASNCLGAPLFGVLGGGSPISITLSLRVFPITQSRGAQHPVKLSSLSLPPPSALPALLGHVASFGTTPAHTGKPREYLIRFLTHPQPLEMQRPWGDMQKGVTSALKLAGAKDMGKGF